MTSATRVSDLCRRARWVGRTRSSATTSVRLAVPAPVRKKRRRTRPITATSSPVDKDSISFRRRGSTIVTGTELFTPSSSSVVTSRATAALPDGRSRQTGGLLKSPLITTTFMTLPSSPRGDKVGVVSARRRCGPRHRRNRRRATRPVGTSRALCADCRLGRRDRRARTTDADGDRAPSSGWQPIEP